MTKWLLEVSDRAQKRLGAIPNPPKQRIIDAIDELLLKGPNKCGLDLKPLKGRPEWRLRVGKWRILLRIHYDIITIIVIAIDSRGDVYK